MLKRALVPTREKRVISGRYGAMDAWYEPARAKAFAAGASLLLVAPAASAPKAAEAAARHARSFRWRFFDGDDVACVVAGDIQGARTKLHGAVKMRFARGVERARS